jgi:hypothetical protein
MAARGANPASSLGMVWHSEQTWPPTNFSGSSASTSDVMQHKVSAMATVAARRTKAVTSAEIILN